MKKRLLQAHYSRIVSFSNNHKFSVILFWMNLIEIVILLVIKDEIRHQTRVSIHAPLPKLLY